MGLVMPARSAVTGPAVAATAAARYRVAVASVSTAKGCKQGQPTPRVRAAALRARGLGIGLAHRTHFLKFDRAVCTVVFVYRHDLFPRVVSLLDPYFTMLVPYSQDRHSTALRLLQSPRRAHPPMRPAYWRTVPHRGMRHSPVKSSDNATAVSTAQGCCKVSGVTHVSPDASGVAKCCSASGMLHSSEAVKGLCYSPTFRR